MGKVKASVFALIDNDNILQGYFKTEQLALNWIEQHELNEAVVLEVILAYRAYAPEEPAYELIDLDLKELGI